MRCCVSNSRARTSSAFPRLTSSSLAQRKSANPECSQLVLQDAQICTFGPVRPICRLHGFRIPDEVPVPEPGEDVTYGKDTVRLFIESGGSNEVRSFGDKVEAVLTRMLGVREKLRPYLQDCFAEFSKSGSPVMAPVFYHFANDTASREDSNRYMLGPDILVAPVLAEATETVQVALPVGGTWLHAWTGTEFEGDKCLANGNRAST